MKKFGFILIVLIVFLTGCNSEKDTIDKEPVEVEVVAIIKEVYVDKKSILVEGIGTNNPLGDLSMINIEDAVITKLDKPATIIDLNEKDEITLKIGEVMESYPTQAKSSKVNVTAVYGKVEDDNDSQAQESINIKLYFLYSDKDDFYLVEEDHEVENVSSIAKTALESLRDNKPMTKDAFSPISKTTKINDIYIKDKIIYVDFTKEIIDNNLGSTGEALSVMAIVNTLTQFNTVEGVVFTIDGSEDIEAWLSNIGNVDKPFVEDLSLVKKK